MATVYIVNKNPDYDYKKALEYGDSLYYLTRGIIDVGHNWNKIVEKMHKDLDDSKPEDFILIVGANILCVLAYSIMKEKHGRVNILFWDISQQYMEFKI